MTYDGWLAQRQAGREARSNSVPCAIISVARLGHAWPLTAEMRRMKRGGRK